MTTRSRQIPSAFTLVEVVLVTGMIAICLVLVLPMSTNEREEAQIAQCAKNQKLLADAAHQYATDYKEKFFYNWYTKLGPDGTQDGSAYANWYDQKRIGRYIFGWSTLPQERMVIQDRELKYGQKGFSHGVFLCPADEVNPTRSYHMNYWGSGVKSGNLPEATIEQQKNQPVMGQVFDRNSSSLDRLLLFADVVGTVSTDDGWVTAGRFGHGGLPGERFGGWRGGVPKHSDAYMDAVVRRFNSQIATDLDYVRHGENDDRRLAEGAVNIAFADAHVALKKHTDLFVSETKQSTYNVLWSPADRKVEDPENADKTTVSMNK